MHELIPTLTQWRDANIPAALATVVATWGSAPRRVGAKMAVNAKGVHVGSVSGGCVEGAVIETALQTIRDRQSRLLHFGVADETAWDVGLACGGEIEVLVQPLDVNDLEMLTFSEQNLDLRGTLTLLSSPWTRVPFSVVGDQIIVGDYDDNFLAPIRKVVSQAQSMSTTLESAGERVRAFIDLYLPPPTLVLIGGVHIAIALAKLAQVVGYHTVLVDPRQGFANRERFPHVNRLLHGYLDEVSNDIVITSQTAIAALTHDPKIDDPALDVALGSPAFYIGALGSRRTHAQRAARLQERGWGETAVARIHAPIGLDIGARTPEEIALAVLAEIVTRRNNK